MIQLLKKYLHRTSLMSKCLAASFLVHSISLYVFYKNPIALYATSIFQKSKPTPSSIFEDTDPRMEQNNQSLAEAFEEILFSSSSPFDAIASNAQIGISPSIELELHPSSYAEEIREFSISLEHEAHLGEPKGLNPSQDLFKEKIHIGETITRLGTEPDLTHLIEEFDLAGRNILPPISSMDINPPDLVDPDLCSHVHDQKIPSHEEMASHTEPGIYPQEMDLLKSTVQLTPIPEKELSSTKETMAVQPRAAADTPITYTEPFTPYEKFSNTPLDEEKLKTMVSITSWSDSFDVKVSISPPTEAGRYVFSLALTPKQNMAYEQIPQNFYFLIDPSSSIDKHKFSLFKRAILKSLTSMHDGDRFNIIVLDKKLSRMSPQNKTLNIRSVQLAEDFLDKVSQSNFLSSSDMLDGLQSVSSLIEDNDHMHTALLLTNGHSSQGFHNQQKSIKSFIEKNGRKMSLYAAAVGNRNNLVNLDMLCSISGGKLLYSDTNASFPRKFALLVKELKTPIAKDITISMITKNPKAGLNVFAKSQQLPALYAQEPYVIIGTIERLSDMTLCLEAKNDSEWINIEKSISFQDAHVDNKLLTRWSQAQIATQYEDFLKDPKSKYLKKAKELLQNTYGKAALE